MADDLKVGFTDPTVLALHRRVVEKIGVKALKAYDRSYSTIDFERTAPGPQTPPADGTLQSYELFQAILSRPELAGVYRRFAGEPFPWKASDNAFNRRLFARFDAMVRRWRQDHPQLDPQGMEMARAIYQWTIRPKREGGMGMAEYQGHPEFTFDQAVRSNLSDCTEVYYILENLGQRAGYSVRPHLVRVDAEGNVVLHVAAGVKVGKKEILVDPLYRRFDAQHRLHTPMNHLQLLSAFESNRGGVAAKKRKYREAKEHYERAILIDPYNAVARLNLANFLIGAGPAKSREALAALEQVRKLAPGWNLYWMDRGLYHDRQGDFTQAVTDLEKALQLEPRERATRVHLVQALACAGRIQEAQAQLKALYDSYGERWSLQERGEYQRLENWLAHQIKTRSCGPSQETSNPPSADNP